MGTRLYFLSSAVWQQPALPTAVVLMGSRGTRMLQALSSCADCTPLCVSRPRPAVEHKQAFLGLSQRRADLCPHTSDGWGQVEQQDVRACAVSCVETWGSTRLHGVCGWTECMEELLWHTSLNIFLIMPRACCMRYCDSHFSSREAAEEQGQDTNVHSTTTGQDLVCGHSQWQCRTRGMSRLLVGSSAVHPSNPEGYGDSDRVMPMCSGLHGIIES